MRRPFRRSPRSAPPRTTRTSCVPAWASCSSRSSGRRAALAYWSVALSTYLAPRQRAALASTGCSRSPTARPWPAGLVHFTAWPWEIRGGVPTLVEAEGLTHEQLTATTGCCAPGCWPRRWACCSRRHAARAAGRCSGSPRRCRCASPPTTTSRGRASRRACIRRTGARRSGDAAARVRRTRAAAASRWSATAAGSRSATRRRHGGLPGGPAGPSAAGTPVEPEPLLPFQPLSMRAFSLFERHHVQAARGLVRRYMPRRCAGRARLRAP